MCGVWSREIAPRRRGVAIVAMSRKRKPPGAAPAPGEGLSTTALVVGVLLLAAAIAAYAILAQFKSAAPAAKPEAAKAFAPLAGLAADAQRRPEAGGPGAPLIRE